MKTTYIGTGFSTKKDSYEAGKIASSQAHQKILQQRPNLVLVFSSIHFQSKKLLDGIYSVFGRETNILGCTGSGIITNSGIYKYGVAIMAIQSTKIKFSTALVREVNRDIPRESGEKFARELLKNPFSKNREMALIFSDGLIENGSEMLFGIKEILGRSFPIVGGSAADNLRFHETYQYFNKEVLNKSLIGAILSGDGVFGYGLKHGWQPLGRPHTVTRSKGNILNEIEGRPALWIYQTYFKKNPKEIKSLLSQIGILYPLGIYLSEEEEYLLRNPIRVDTNDALICQGDIPTGSQIRIMMGTKESALQAAKQATWEAKNALRDVQPLAAIIFESASRIKLLGYKANEEVSIIKNILGDGIPFMGVCTFGEQAPLKSLGYLGESRFHNEAIVVLTIGERRVFK